LKKYVDGGAVLGYGTTSGGKMLIKDKYTGNQEYLEDRSDYPYEVAISKIDENNLKKIASDMGIDYINMSKQSNINSKLKEIKAKIVNSNEGTSTKTYTDIYYVFAIPLVLLLGYEFINYRRKL